MARKIAAKPTSTRKPRPAQSAEGISIRIEVDPRDDTPVYYSNYVEVSTSQHEICLSFVRVPTKLSTERSEEAKSSGALTLEPELQVIISPTLIDGLIKALNTSKEQYASRFGAAAAQKTTGDSDG